MELSLATHRLEAQEHWGWTYMELLDNPGTVSALLRKIGVEASKVFNNISSWPLFPSRTKTQVWSGGGADVGMTNSLQ